MLSSARSAWARASSPAGVHLDDVAPPVVGVATPLDEPLVLEVVQQEDEVVGVEVQRLAELLLRGVPLVSEVVERDVLLEPDPEQLFARAAVDDAREPRQQHHRSGRPRMLHFGVNRSMRDDSLARQDNHCYSDDHAKRYELRQRSSLARARGGLRRPAHDRARHDDRERRAARDPQPTSASARPTSPG